MEEVNDIFNLTPEEQNKVDSIIIETLLGEYVKERIITKNEYDKLIKKIMCTLNMVNNMC